MTNNSNANFKALKRVQHPYRVHLIIMMTLQFVILFFAGSVLDGGYISTGANAAAISYWGGTITVFIRRPSTPTKSDYRYIYWGLPVLTVLWISLMLNI
jgi:hypothetical protein